MKTITIRSMLFALAVLAAASAGAATYDIDASHSSVEFKVRHLVISNVRGAFQDFTVDALEFDPADPQSWRVEAAVMTASVDTDDQKRDEHLRTDDFLDVEKYPRMTFVSTGVEPKGEHYALHGDLTIRDVTKRVAFDLTVNGTVKDPWGGERAGFTATARIDRRDFGLTWNKAIETGGVVVGNEVTITLEIEAVKR